MRALKTFFIGPKTLTFTLLAIIATLLTTGKPASLLREGKWKKTELNVCFADPRDKNDSRFGEDSKTFHKGGSLKKVKLIEIPTREREWIRSIIEQEYRADRTIVHFTGWKDCDPARPADVWLYMGKGGPQGAANTGEKMTIDHYIAVGPQDNPHEMIPVYKKDQSLKPSYIYLRKNNQEERGKLLTEEMELKLVALHEFGHATGLVHENESEGAERDGNCSLAGQSRMKFRIMRKELETQTAYDPGSIMNYCYTFAISTATGLKYDVAKSSFDPRTIPSQGLPIILWPGIQGLDSGRIVSRVELQDRIRFEIRPGLSPADAHTLRCIYGAQDEASKKLCNEKTLPHTL